MDLKNLRTFIQVAELGSFTKAAQRLGFSQPTVTFQIKQLEAELDVRLFERVRHTVTLTEQGRTVLSRAYQMDQLTQELARDLHEAGEVTGHIHLAMADSLVALLGRAFQSFWRDWPGIRLKITTAGTEEMFRLLNHNEADQVMTLDSRVYDAEYIIVHEEKVTAHFVAPADSPLAGRDSVSVQEVLEQPFLLTEKGMSYRRLLDERLAARSLEIVPALETGDVALICRLTAQGAGCSFLPDYATQEAVEAGRLARLPVGASRSACGSSCSATGTSGCLPSFERSWSTAPCSDPAGLRFDFAQCLRADPPAYAIRQWTTSGKRTH